MRIRKGSLRELGSLGKNLSHIPDHKWCHPLCARQVYPGRLLSACKRDDMRTYTWLRRIESLAVALGVDHSP